jgi:branched-chain amino acid transport system permease protein
MRELLGVGLLLPLLNSALHWNALPAFCQILIYVMLSQGLNWVVGFAGLLHLGYAAFFAIGAFAMAYLTSPQSPLHWQLSFYAGLPLSVLVTAGLGALLAWPTLKLRGDYLAIVTMGFGLMLDPLLRNYDQTTKAITGMSGIAAPFTNGVFWYYLLLAAVLVSLALSHRLRHSSLGRALRAIREDAIAAQACGISLGRTKLAVLTLAAALAGLAGALYASYIVTLNLSFPLDFNGSIMILAMIILGGIGSTEGALVGALSLGGINLILIPQLIDLTQSWLDLSKAQFLLFGLTLVLMMLLRPEGLIPEKAVRYK